MSKQAQVDLEQLVQVIQKEVARQIALQKPQVVESTSSGAIVKNFNSTGIQDSATDCRLTIMDQATVFENTLVATGLEIKGDVKIDGDMFIGGEIPIDSPFYRDLVSHSAGLLKLTMEGNLYLEFADKILEKIKVDGLDLNKVSVDGKPMIDGNQLGYFVTHSNLQTVGELRKLVTIGDTYLNNETVYVGNKRVGINTDQPSATFTVLDKECEVVIKKLRDNVSFIGSTRTQRVVLGANGKNNLTLETDGTVTVDKLNIGAIQFYSSATVPEFNADKGVICFNEEPDYEQPIGWVSLGYNKWAPFGVVSKQ